MQVLDYMGIIDTGEEDRLYKDPVVVAKVKGDVYAAIDTKEKTVKFYPFWAPMTKFDIGGFFIVTLDYQIPEKIKMRAERIVAGITGRDENYARAVEMVNKDRDNKHGMVAADARLLQEVKRNLEKWKAEHPTGDGEYVNFY